MTADEASQSARLDDGALTELAQRFGGAEALALTGSYARGNASRHSDVDLLRFVTLEPTSERERYHLWLVAGRLVSVTTTTLAAKRAELARPESALWAVPGLRQARILADRDGRLAALIAEAQSFTWTPVLRLAAHDYASDTLAGLAEEVHKLLGACERDDTATMLYATLGLQQGLTRAALVARGALLETENAYFAEALRLELPDSRWQRLLRVVIGYEPPASGKSLPRERSEAALWLYVEAARLLAKVLTEEDGALVAATVARIQRTLAESTS